MRRRDRLSLIIVLVLQVIAVVLYSPSFFSRAPQAAVLPPAMLLLFVLSLVGMNTGFLTLTGGRVSLVFIQGINIVVRLMMLLPGAETAEGGVDLVNLFMMIVGIGLSWYTIMWMERAVPRSLLLFKRGGP